MKTTYLVTTVDPTSASEMACCQSFPLFSAWSLNEFKKASRESVRTTLKATSTLRSAPFSFMIILASKPGQTLTLWASSE